LQNEINLLQGIKPLKGLPPEIPFQFPIGTIHEFICSSPEEKAASSAFLAGILGILMKNGGVTAWISLNNIVFPSALKAFGIDPHHIIFIDPKNQKDLLWAIEEALKCEGLAAVVGEIAEISFIASRKLQLAVEQSRVTGILLRVNPRQLNYTASAMRWKISHLPSDLQDNLPGVGYPKWQVDILKQKN
jgi:protein ImuA